MPPKPKPKSPPRRMVQEVLPFIPPPPEPRLSREDVLDLVREELATSEILKAVVMGEVARVLAYLTRDDEAGRARAWARYKEMTDEIHAPPRKQTAGPEKKVAKRARPTKKK